MLAGVLVCVSRCALALACLRGVPAARADGLGVEFTESVGPVASTCTWLAAAAVCATAFAWAGLDWWRGLAAVGLAAIVVGVLVRRTITRFGGVTGDVFGAASSSPWRVLLLGAT